MAQPDKTRGGKRPNAGRKPGIPNRRTLHLVAVLAERGIEPALELARIARTTKDADLAARCWATLCSLAYPKRGAVATAPEAAQRPAPTIQPPEPAAAPEPVGAARYKPILPPMRDDWIAPSTSPADELWSQPQTDYALNPYEGYPGGFLHDR